MNENGAYEYPGRHRATVVNILDPEQRGRIQALVPDVLGMTPTTWALPSFPVAGKQMGVYAVPQIGSGVWIEFEQGDPDHPIWTGCFWGMAAEVPALALAGNPASPSIVLQTGGQNTIMISDVPGPAGGILLKTASGALISISDTGITISNGKGATITMTGPVTDINAGALTIT